jgi:NADP-dependent 3-hydroxy acid dehydrogenase YdfG
MSDAPYASPVAVVTGASSGIGAASARALGRAGFHTVVGARREDRLRTLADHIGGEARPLDVTDDASVAAFCEPISSCSVLVNNAGGAVGLDRIEDADLDDWQAMYDTTVLGTLRMTRALLPALRASGDGLVVVIGSVAGLETYVGGAGYTAAKFAERAFTQTLRQELFGEPIRVTEIDPGLVQTEFSTVRFGGDSERAAAIYEGVEPLNADDVAQCVAFAATRPSRVNLDRMVVLARDQLGATGRVDRLPGRD